MELFLNSTSVAANAIHSIQSGDVLRHTGVTYCNCVDNYINDVEFIDEDGNEVTINARQLMCAKGTIQLFFRNFPTLEDALNRALKVDLRFIVTGVYQEGKHRYYIIDCEN